MPQTVDVAGVGPIPFPDDWSPDRIADYLNNSDQFAPVRVSLAGREGPKAKRNALLREEQRMAGQTREDPRGWEGGLPSKAMDWAYTIVQPYARTTANVLPAASRLLDTILRTGPAAAGTVEQSIRNQKFTPVGIGATKETPFGRYDTWFNEVNDREAPPLPDMGVAGEIAGVLSGGAASVATSVIPGAAVAKFGPAVAAATSLATALPQEFADTYHAVLDRQRAQGRPKDESEAAAKAALYTGVAAPVELLGAPRIARRIATAPGVRKVLAKFGTEALVGATQEGIQSLEQQAIVNDGLDIRDPAVWKQAGLEALGGAFGQGVFSGVQQHIDNKAARGIAAEYQGIAQDQRAAKAAFDQAIAQARAAAEAIANSKSEAEAAQLAYNAEQARLAAEKAAAVLVTAQQKQSVFAMKVGSMQDEEQRDAIIASMNVSPEERDQIRYALAMGKGMSAAQQMAFNLHKEAKDQERDAAAKVRAQELADFNARIDQLLKVPKRPAGESPVTLDPDEFTATHSVFPVQLMRRAQQWGNLPPMVRDAMVRLAQQYPIAEEEKSPLYRDWVIQGPEGLRRVFEPADEPSPSDLWTMAGRRHGVTSQWFQEGQEKPQRKAPVQKSVAPTPVPVPVVPVPVVKAPKKAPKLRGVRKVAPAAVDETGFTPEELGAEISGDAVPVRAPAKLRGPVPAKTKKVVKVLTPKTPKVRIVPASEDITGPAKPAPPAPVNLGVNYQALSLQAGVPVERLSRAVNIAFEFFETNRGEYKNPAMFTANLADALKIPQPAAAAIMKAVQAAGGPRLIRDQIAVIVVGELAKPAAAPSLVAAAPVPVATSDTSDERDREQIKTALDAGRSIPDDVIKRVAANIETFRSGTASPEEQAKSLQALETQLGGQEAAKIILRLPRVIRGDPKFLNRTAILIKKSYLYTKPEAAAAAKPPAPVEKQSSEAIAGIDDRTANFIEFLFAQGLDNRQIAEQALRGLSRSEQIRIIREVEDSRGVPGIFTPERDAWAKAYNKNAAAKSDALGKQAPELIRQFLNAATEERYLAAINAIAARFPGVSSEAGEYLRAFEKSKPKDTSDKAIDAFFKKKIKKDAAERAKEEKSDQDGDEEDVEGEGGSIESGANTDEENPSAEPIGGNYSKLTKEHLAPFIKLGARIEEVGDHYLGIRYDYDGNLTFAYDPSVFTPSVFKQRKKEWISDAMEERDVLLSEELIHLAQLTLMRDQWLTNGKKSRSGLDVSFSSYVEFESTRLLEELPIEARNHTIGIYGHKRWLTDVNVLAEFLRIAIQEVRNGKVTEPTTLGLTDRIVNFLKGIRDILKGIFQDNKYPTVKKSIDDIQAVLDYAEGKRSSSPINNKELGDTAGSRQAASGATLVETGGSIQSGKFFKSPQEVDEATSRIGTTPEDVDTIRGRAAAQSMMIPTGDVQDINRWRTAPGVSRPERKAGNLLHLVEKLATAVPLQLRISSLPEADKGAASSVVIKADEALKELTQRLIAKEQSANEELERFMDSLKTPSGFDKLNIEMAEAAYFDRMRKELPHYWAQHVANQLRGAPAGSTAEGELQAILQKAARKTDRSMIDRADALNLLLQIADNPAIVIGPGTTSADLMSQIKAVGGWKGSDPDTMLYLLDGGPGGTKPGLLMVPNLPLKIRTIRALRIERGATLQQAWNFASTFSKTSAKSGNVSPLQFAARFQVYINAHRDAADMAFELNRKLNRLQDNALGAMLANDKLRQITVSGQYQGQLTEAQQNTDTIYGTQWEYHADLGKFTLVLPISTNQKGEFEVLDFPLEQSVEGDNKIKINLVRAMQEITWYLSQPTADPIMRATYTKILRELEDRWMDPSMWTEHNIFRGYKGRRIAKDVTKVITQTGNVPSTIYGESGGRLADRPSRLGQAVNFLQRLMLNIAHNGRYGDAASANLMAQAMVEHGLAGKSLIRGRPRVSVQQLAVYQNEILNPLLASWQEAGDMPLRVGSKTIYGHTITAKDMEVAERQKEREDKVHRASEMDVAKYGEPSRIEEGEGKAKIKRKAIASGRLMVPRRFSRDAQQLASTWEEKTDAEKMDYTWNRHHFLDTILPFVVERSPRFSRGSSFNQVFDRIAFDIAYNNLIVEDYDDLKQAVEDRSQMPTDPDLHKKLEADLSEHVLGYLNRLSQAIRSEASLEANRAPTTMTMAGQAVGVGEFDATSRMMLASLRTEGSFLNPRGEMIAPSNWYQYARTSWADGAALRSNAVNIARVRWIESMIGYSKALKIARDKLTEETIAEFGKHFSPAQRQTKSIELQRLGQQRHTYAELSRLIADIDVQIELARRWMNRTVKDADKGTQNLWRSVGHFLSLNLLTGFKTVSANVLGGAALGSFNMASQIGGYTRLTSPFVGMANTAPAAAALLAEWLTRTFPNAKALAKLVERNLKGILPGIAESMRSHHERIQRMRQSGVLVDSDWRSTRQAKKIYGRLGPVDPSQAPQNVLEKVAAGIGSNAWIDFLRWVNPRIADQVVNLAMSRQAEIIADELASYWEQIRATRPGPLDPGNPSSLIKADQIGKSEPQMRHLREFLRPVGGLEALMFDYIRRMEATPVAGRADVEFLTPDQMATWGQAVLESGNLVGDTNSPMVFKTSEMMGLAGMFKNWASQNIDSQIKNFGWMQGGDSPWKRLALALALFAALILQLIPSYELMILGNTLWSGTSPSKVTLGNVINNPISMDGLKYALTAASAAIPVVGNVVDRLFNGGNSRPIGDLTSMVPAAGLVADIFSTAQRAYNGGDLAGAMGDFTMRWVPGTQPILSRMPFYQQQVEIRNALRSGRASAPVDFELRQPGGNVRTSPLTGRYRAIEGAAYRGDTGEVRRLYGEAVQEQMRLRGVDRAEAERQVKSALRSRTVETRLFPRQLTDLQRSQWEGRMSSRQREDIGRARRAEDLISSAVLGVSRRAAGAGRRRGTQVGGLAAPRALRKLRSRRTRASRGRRTRGVSAFASQRNRAYPTLRLPRI